MLGMPSPEGSHAGDVGGAGAREPGVQANFGWPDCTGGAQSK